ncbi:hypothetical protein BCR34DRAFT_565324 [Clohesyomyces aquaticus]|uniref:Uncharacterized protein n=1 Tax=Clohesyomyces aquaticus TaxID=1231657 RepID=A0A1Y1ZMG9_9PLEO|nr:hypothetical protein BCR34DRAFT_565324 [Clohesyomyces aquaticus]
MLSAPLAAVRFSFWATLVCCADLPDREGPPPDTGSLLLQPLRFLWPQDGPDVPLHRQMEGAFRLSLALRHLGYDGDPPLSCASLADSSGRSGKRWTWRFQPLNRPLGSQGHRGCSLAWAQPGLGLAECYELVFSPLFGCWSRGRPRT